MWKFVARGIRESLERRACRTNVYSQTPQDSNVKGEVKTSLTCNHKFLAPSISAYKHEYCGSKRTGDTEDKDYESKWNAKHTWSEAVGWSSVLAIGWVVCQTLCLRRRVFEKEKNESLRDKVLQLSEARVSYLFGQVLDRQPKYFLPIINCVGKGNIKYAQEERSTEWKADKPFGPITIEEALKEASDEFAKTHKLVTGEFQLRFGVKALEEERYRDAITHFTAGAKLSSPGSMFNLGICYELGLGILADQAKAAKYYSDAAKQDHPDALYNLGVFHAQGRGGLPVDIERARKCFTKAASLGQIEARRALELEKHRFPPAGIDDSSCFFNARQHSVHVTEDDRNITDILTKLVGYENVASLRLKEIPFNPRSTIGTEGSTDARETCLEFLGLNGSRSTPVSRLSNDCPVSY
ncbi:hypothetical protein KM043_003825 [Ampulex compressa]|nr:hypothetical protein KM043_003825 [Ampulex compressa]